jgi:putative nucleotidyltransferase with HDIG domain
LRKPSEFIKFIFIGLLGLLLVRLYTLAFPFPAFYRLNDLSSWYRYYLLRGSLRRLNLVAISVDNHSLNSINQRWPWKRSLYARLIRLLDREQVNTIALDFAFLGESEEPAEDTTFQETLSAVSSKVILAYIFDQQQKIPLLPLGQLGEAAYAAGVLNTPIDPDGVSRRLRTYIERDGQRYYSFSVATAAAYLNKQPKEILPMFQVYTERTFLINYLLRPRDLKVLSFYECLEDLPKLKSRYGQTFLKDALVVVYPGAEIHHDIHLTPLGRMPGGFLHLNGIADILTKRTIREVKTLVIPLIIFSGTALVYILSYSGFVSGLLLALGLLILDFWIFILAGLRGIWFDYAYVAVYCLFFFALGSLYKYLYYFIQIARIKDKATIDPLRGLYTLKYFYYRLGLQAHKIYFFKEQFLVLVSLPALKEAFEGLPLDKVRQVWKELSFCFYSQGVFWSVYSAEEVVGCLLSRPQRVEFKIESLLRRLEVVLARNKLPGGQIRLGCLRLKKRYALAGMLEFISSLLGQVKPGAVLFSEDDLSRFESGGQIIGDSDEFLAGLGRDIEEKNRQLLSLIDNLNKEHVKTKEAFFQIITSLVNALEARDPYTEGHSERVAKYALMLVDKLGWSQEAREKLKKAALLHDLGKIGIPDSILHKKGRLTDEEFGFIKKHEIIAVKILEPLKEFSEILPWVLYHHERWDGKGYPQGLAGEAIPEAAQILSLADVFDAITTGRDYKPAFSVEAAVQEITRNKGSQFNPRLADLFIGIAPLLKPAEK